MFAQCNILEAAPGLQEHLKGKRHAANQLAIRRQDFERATPSQATLTSDGPAEVAEDLRNGTDGMRRIVLRFDLLSLAGLSISFLARVFRCASQQQRLV